MEKYDRLKIIREQLGKTQKEMALILGVAARTWQNYEEGIHDPSWKVLEGLAKLGFNINWILTGEGEINSSEGSTKLKYTKLPKLVTDRREFKDMSEYYTELFLPNIIAGVLGLQDRLSLSLSTKKQIQAIEAFSYAKDIDFDLLETIFTLTEKGIKQLNVHYAIYGLVKIHSIVGLYQKYFRTDIELKSGVVNAYVRAMAVNVLDELKETIGNDENAKSDDLG